VDILIKKIRNTRKGLEALIIRKINNRKKWGKTKVKTRDERVRLSPSLRREEPTGWKRI